MTNEKGNMGPTSFNTGAPPTPTGNIYTLKLMFNRADPGPDKLMWEFYWRDKESPRDQPLPSDQYYRYTLQTGNDMDIDVQEFSMDSGGAKPLDTSFGGILSLVFTPLDNGAVTPLYVGKERVQVTDLLNIRVQREASAGVRGITPDTFSSAKRVMSAGVATESSGVRRWRIGVRKQPSIMGQQAVYHDYELAGRLLVDDEEYTFDPTVRIGPL